MWLTGFDAPSMHTMYIDKPMKGHGLMQAIARVNRVFKDKPGGLIVDYIGIAQNLKNALGDYSDRDKNETGISQEEAVAVMLEKYQIVKDMFFGFDYVAGLKGKAKDRLSVIAGAMEWILEAQRKDSEKTESEEEKKQIHRRYSDAVLNLSQAFALAASSDDAKTIRDEVGFFQAIRAALAKSDGKKKKTREDEFAVQQLISNAVISTDIVDILKAAGVDINDSGSFKDLPPATKVKLDPLVLGMNTDPYKEINRLQIFSAKLKRNDPDYVKKQNRIKNMIELNRIQIQKQAELKRLGTIRQFNFRDFMALDNNVADILVETYDFDATPKQTGGYLTLGDSDKQRTLIN